MLRYLSTRNLLARLASPALLAFAATAQAQIYGTMANFDTYNTTPEPAEGAEIELEGIHSSSLYSTFPAHFSSKSVSDYDDGLHFGVRIRYEDYNFNAAVTMGSLQPNPDPINTNGHALVNTVGGEHFGFAVTEQATAARFYWLNRLPDGSYGRISGDPLAIPQPTWAYIPPNGGGAPRIEVQAELPENEHEVKKPDPVWMTVYTSEEDRNIRLDELMSGNDSGNIVPQSASQIETEWELLEGGQLAKHGGKLQDQISKSTILRFETFKYTGPVNAENEPTSLFKIQNLDAPPEGELGDFIAANMVAANLAPLNLKLGDYDSNGLVDGMDFLKWQSQQGGRGVLASDDNGDNRVDDDDLRLWRTHFQTAPAGGAAAPPAAVPEPGSALLLVAALVGLRRIRKSADYGDWYNS
jgi:hypothetical protein